MTQNISTNQKVLNLYKTAGETPLERIDRFRLENPLFKDVTLSYVGRLDPLASGVLLVVVGEENKKRENYLKYDKEYTLEILWGVETDTYDVLGKISNSAPLGKEFPNEEILKNELVNFVGKFDQSYPPYSSKTVSGTPLFEWARLGKINEIEIPKKEVEIKNIEFIKNYAIDVRDILPLVEDKVKSVVGDFRQDEIFNKWKDLITKSKRDNYLVSVIKVSSSGGVYMRSLAYELGRKFGCGAIAWKISRERVGDFLVKDSI